MPRFHLHLFNDIDVPDEDGSDYPDLATARAEAIRSARAMMAEHLLAGRSIALGHRINVADEQGKVLASIPFRELITVVD
ncbi:MAG: hypothetical protein KYX69_11510 [Sphingomonas sp.]|uniref:DUF6894 family protein n=1 Tax=Sphingomonas sp. TaxID=28214 RepID=UPI002602E87B|nr:hypothetical protein [Sphingomonas sp.]MDK2768332.1 hypothetical protein [Sphingomonas sp.]